MRNIVIFRVGGVEPSKKPRFMRPIPSTAVSYGFDARCFREGKTRRARGLKSGEKTMKRKSGKSTRLFLESLETRDLMAADPFAIQAPVSNPNGDSVLPGLGFPGQFSGLAAASTIG